MSLSTDRLFFALRPDPVAAAAMAKLGRDLRTRHHLQGQPLPSHRLHVTLCFLGDFPSLPRALVATAGKAAAGVSAPSFDTTFDWVMSFPGRRARRPLVLRGDQGVTAIEVLNASLAAALQREGIEPEPKSLPGQYIPHVTLLYNEQRLAAESVAPLSWRVREFILVHSLVGKGLHEELGRWALI